MTDYSQKDFKERLEKEKELLNIQKIVDDILKKGPTTESKEKNIKTYDDVDKMRQPIIKWARLHIQRARRELFDSAHEIEKFKKFVLSLENVPKEITPGSPEEDEWFTMYEDAIVKIKTVYDVDFGYSFAKIFVHSKITDLKYQHAEMFSKLD
jgi:hypothetical protein